MEEITGVKSEDNEDLVYSDDDDNLSTVPEEDVEPYAQPDSHNTTRRPGRLSPRPVVSNIAPAVPVSYPDPELVAPAGTSERRHLSRERKLDGCIMLEQPYGIINILQYFTFIGTGSAQKKYFIVDFLISVLECW